MFDFHSDYDIMVIKEIITAHRDFHNSLVKCFVSEVRLSFLHDYDYPKTALSIG